MMRLSLLMGIFAIGFISCAHSHLLDERNNACPSQDRQDGSCDKSHPCAPGQCCSKWGYCGKGPAYCSNEIGACVDGVCPKGLCCSRFNFCGSGPEYCPAPSPGDCRPPPPNSECKQEKKCHGECHCGHNDHKEHHGQGGHSGHSGNGWDKRLE